MSELMTVRQMARILTHYEEATRCHENATAEWGKSKERNRIKEDRKMILAAYSAALAAKHDPRVTALVEPSDVPYPPFECLRILSDFADMMLADRDYDGHDWEQVMEASNAAKGHLAALTAAKGEQQL